MQSLYVETTIPSYLAARPSRDALVLVRQQLTRHWWDCFRHDYELYVSDLVLTEIQRGNKEFAINRERYIADLSILAVTDAAAELADTLLARVPMPAKAAADAVHIAVAVLNGIDMVLTWNCRHLANPFIRRRIEEECSALGHIPPIICTPEDLLSYEDDTELE